MSEGKFDIKLMSEFDSSAPGPNVVEWIDKVELVCQMCEVKWPEHMIPLRLFGGVFVIYQQLSEEDKADIEHIKSVIYTAFTMDRFVAYEQLSEWHL